MAGTSRFDCYPSDFLNGIIGLKADQISLYTVMMMIQYDDGEPVRFEDREREIAVRAGMSLGRARAAISHLRSIGKLEPKGQGLSNPRTERELDKIERRFAENRENSQKGGNANREKWEEKRRKINGDESRPAIRSDSQNIALLPSSSVLQPEEDPSDLCPNAVRTRHVYPLDFEEWWRDYPTDNNMSKATALKAWKRLTEVDKRDAKSSLSAYNRYCTSRPDYRPLHAANFLSQRRWEGHLQTAIAAKKRVFLHRDTPQWSAWEKHLKRMPPVDQNGGWWFDSEWPPHENAREHARMTA